MANPISDSEISTCGYTVFAGGDRNFFESVSIPLADTLRNELKNDDSTKIANDRPDYLDIDSRPTSDGSILIGGIVGVFAFFASWLAAKILDDIYEAKFQPAIRQALGAADDKLEGANARKPKMLQLGISYADKRVFILIGIVGDTFAEILDAEHMIKVVHRNAVEWIETNSFNEQVHLYIVKRGSVNVEPLLFENLMLAHLHIRGIGCNTPEF